MAFLGCSCKKELKSGRATGVGRLKAKTSIGLSVLSQLSATSNIRENVSKDHANRITLAGVGSLTAKETQDHTPSTTNKLTGEGSIASKMTLNVKMRANISGDSDLTQAFADKFSGDFDKMPSGFLSTQKLYPIADAVNNGFIDEAEQAVDIYDSIDEGVYTGNIYDDNSEIVADDHTWITPNSIETVGDYAYKAEVTAPMITPDESFLIFRALAPTSDYQSLKSPIYTLYDILLTETCIC